jgi:hypothetical protein
VHCIDTEGPLYESIRETFKRLKSIFNIDIEPTRENLAKLQNKKIDLGGLENSVQKAFNPKLLNYLDTWDKIDEMLDEILSENFRGKFPDSNNNGWIFNWHCLDHVYYNINPRRRDIGFHNIFDHYQEKLITTDSKQDGLHFHFHPNHPILKDASISATHWFSSSNHLFEILSRRIIDHNWFPSVNRPGFHVNRPDSNWFLEQYIPFDYSNQSVQLTKDDENQIDLADGRFGDWRRAPKTWTPYHPAHDDYQEPGDCRRWIARCLNIGTRLRLLTEKEIASAFEESQNGKPVILAFTNHDFRDIRDDISNTYSMIKKVSADFPGVNFEYAEAVDAFRNTMGLPLEPRCELDVGLNQNGSGHLLTISASQKTFGPQPFFCYRTRTGKYVHDNLDFEESFKKWTYSFDDQTVQLDSIDQIGIGTNTGYGITTVVNIDARSGDVTSKYWNEPDSNIS